MDSGNTPNLKRTHTNGNGKIVDKASNIILEDLPRPEYSKIRDRLWSGIMSTFKHSAEIQHDNIKHTAEISSIRMPTLKYKYSTYTRSLKMEESKKLKSSRDL